ncbi:DNA-binding SARP family transcriptional activator [Streptomyces sp. 846.5]|nr:DNA-binding SARP family transcriptional activator [Streptomyces sp. 846.5]
MPESSEQVRFGLLGPLQASHAGTGRHVPPGRQRTLLAVLLTRPNRTVAAHELAAQVWDRSPSTETAATLRSYVMRLRRSLGPVPGARILTRPPGYAIEIREDGELDTLDFAALRDRAETAAAREDWDTAAGELRAALGLWRGEPLEDLAEGPLTRSERPSLLEGRLQARIRLAEMELELGRHSEAVELVSPLQAENPFRENLSGLLMIALYRSGRQADALKVYRVVRELLSRELGVEPGPTLAQVHQRILGLDPSLLYTAPRPRTVLHSSTVPDPSQLPADIADFTGREEDVARIRAVLSSAAVSGQARPVAISVVSGTGGVGKTTLAVHVAHQLVPDFPDGQLYVDLHGVDAAPAEANEVLAGFLRELGVPETDMPLDRDARATRYRSLLAGRRTLVVLDNAKDITQIRPLGTCQVK